MTNTNKLEGQLLLVIDGEVQRGLFKTITGVEDGLARMIAEDADKKEELKHARIEILNVVGQLDSRFHFKLDFLQDDPYIGGEEDKDEIECEWKVEDTNRTFSDIDDLKDYLKDIIKDGEYTADEVKNFEIYRMTTTEIEFDRIDEGDIEVEIQLNSVGEVIESTFGTEFYRADITNVGEIVHEELEKELANRNLIDLNRSIGVMSLDDIEKEIELLQDRILELHNVKRQRKNEF